MKRTIKKGDGRLARAVLTKEQYEIMWSLYEKGDLDYTQIAEKMGIQRSTVRRYVTVGNATYPPLQERLSTKNAQRAAALSRGHAEKTAQHYADACSAYEDVTGCARTYIQAMKAALDAAKAKAFAGVDHKEMGQIIRNVNEITDASEKWRGIMRAFVAGEDNEDTMNDLDDFAKTGAVSEGLKERMRKILGEENTTNKGA